MIPFLCFLCVNFFGYVIISIIMSNPNPNSDDSDINESDSRNSNKSINIKDPLKKTRQREPSFDLSSSSKHYKKNTSKKFKPSMSNRTSPPLPGSSGLNVSSNSMDSDLNNPLDKTLTDQSSNIIDVPSDSTVLPNRHISILNQSKNNIYNSKNLPPFLVHVESLNGNIGNLHPLSIGKILYKHLNFNDPISNIQKIGTNLIGINFKRFQDANSFISNHSFLPDNWIPYIPNYKICRTGIVRGVSLDFSLDDIIQSISWPDNPIEIRDISRLKYRDRKDNNNLKDNYH